MRRQKLTIAGGNSTLLVWNCPQIQRSEIINRYLGEVEQKCNKFTVAAKVVKIGEDYD
ncbi:hypothetical protein HYT74_01965 [Candidatus Daviesbacteria bacterium]|nr:hypothetical protein [Candidatus Daviesbacteria bacterium]